MSRENGQALRMSSSHSESLPVRSFLPPSKGARAGAHPASFLACRSGARQECQEGCYQEGGLPCFGLGR